MQQDTEEIKNLLESLARLDIDADRDEEIAEMYFDTLDNLSKYIDELFELKGQLFK